ncbi:MAG TPA: RluA family pseudouridine synthase [Thermoanaerobaculaceae bacterium]|nr:RluA family pseudouridine synthase [Thermoanaerobaculaceae bacterium]
MPSTVCDPAAVSADIVYIDEHLVAINKPAGVSLATRRSEPHAAVARLLAALPDDTCRDYGLTADALWLVHRLDVGTSGLVVLARDADIHRALVSAFAQRRVAKLYLALVWGCPRPNQGAWEWPLGPDRSDRRRMRVEPSGRRAVTEYSLLARGPHASLLRLAPATGRTHQLRVHLAHAGHPIVGDDLYGGPRHRGVRDPRLRVVLAPLHLFLHAWSLHLPSAGHMPELVLTAQLPPQFAAALDSLGIPPPALPGTPTRRHNWS